MKRLLVGNSWVGFSYQQGNLLPADFNTWAQSTFKNLYALLFLYKLIGLLSFCILPFSAVFVVWFYLAVNFWLWYVSSIDKIMMFINLSNSASESYIFLFWVLNNLFLVNDYNNVVTLNIDLLPFLKSVLFTVSQKLLLEIPNYQDQTCNS